MHDKWAKKKQVNQSDKGTSHARMCGLTYLLTDAEQNLDKEWPHDMHVTMEYNYLVRFFQTSCSSSYMTAPSFMFENVMSNVTIVHVASKPQLRVREGVGEIQMAPSHTLEPRGC